MVVLRLPQGKTFILDDLHLSNSTDSYTTTSSPRSGKRQTYVSSSSTLIRRNIIALRTVAVVISEEYISKRVSYGNNDTLSFKVKQLIHYDIFSLFNGFSVI